MFKFDVSRNDDNSSIDLSKVQALRWLSITYFVPCLPSVICIGSNVQSDSMYHQLPNHDGLEKVLLYNTLNYGTVYII